MIAGMLTVGTSSEMPSADGGFRRSRLTYVAGLILFGFPCFAQQPQPPPSPGQIPSAGGAPTVSSPLGIQPDRLDPSGMENSPSMTPGVITVNSESAHMVDAEACNSWTDSGIHSPTVSVARLQVPDKASGEFQKACSSYKGKKYIEAETHARSALDIYPNYAASWVLLGQVLDAQHKRDDAEKACSQAITVDPTYVAPYLCLAEFAARDEDWKTVSRLSDQALAIDPTSNAYALYYSAAASFHTRKFTDAETNAKAASDLDPWHHLPQVHLLLANIYAAKGDPHAETSELKEYLKIAANSPDAPVARAMLKQATENPPTTPPATTDSSTPPATPIATTPK